MENPVNALEWIERLGGWAVVLLIVRWFMQRMDKKDAQIAELIKSFQGAITTFEEFEKEERLTHSVLLRKLERIEGRDL